MQSNPNGKIHLVRRLAISALWAIAAAVGVVSACARQPDTGWTSGKTNERRDAPTRDAPTQDAPIHRRPKVTEAQFQSEVQLRPSQPSAGDEVELRVAIRDSTGQAVTELESSHERPLHVMILSKDLDRFAHVHPVLDGDWFRVRHQFDRGGEYIVIVDYQQSGRGQVADQHRVQVRGPEPSPLPLSESPRKQRANGLELTLHSEHELRAGETANLHFDVVESETGMPAADLERYLGARAHFVALSADGKDFVHVHAIDAGPPSRVSAHADFPRPGLYKLWAQMQRRGEVVTVPFVLRIRPPHNDGPPNHGAGTSRDHAHHGH